MKRTGVNVQTEAQEQKALFEWADRVRGRIPEVALMFHVANGGSRNLIEAHHLREQGVKAGVPDIILPVARGGYHSLYIELKRQKGGRVSDAQRGWLNALNRAGNLAVVCNGAGAAMTVIMDYLKMN